MASPFAIPRQTKAILVWRDPAQRKLALGLLKPDSGRIAVLGEEITTMTEDQLFELRRRVGIVFQESAL